ncbi:MAG: substrate-binding domain-containing protein [Granulosicoccus sp.]|nr:substrate-binding domain-containing protein [Granulosicoccus sp.]
MNRQVKARPIIAMIGDELSAFQRPIVACVNQCLGKAGFGLLYVCGGPLKPTADWDDNVPVARNAIYTLTREYPVDGYIVFTDSIGSHATIDSLACFVRHYTHRPVVCYGPGPDEVACVQLDNYSSMVSMMEHMTSDPQRRRFVFLRGYPDSPSSSDRERAFRDILTSRGIPVDESLLLNGNYQPVDAFDAMDALLESTHDIDAVVAANDDMAQSAIHALLKHGLQIPQQVIVSGFDDSAAADRSIPSLTTVHYSQETMARQVVETLLMQIEATDVDVPSRRVVTVPAKIVIRASTEKQFLPSTLETEHISAFDAANFRATVLKNLQVLKTPRGLKAREVVDDIVSMLVNGTRYSGSRLESALRRLHDRPDDVYWWRHLHQQITTNLQRCSSEGQSPDALALTASILGQIHQTTWKVENALSVEDARYVQGILQFRARLAQVNSIADLLALLKVINEQFPVKASFLCLYETAGECPDKSTRLLARWPEDCVDHDLQTSFPSTEVLPDNYLHSEFPGPLVLQPMCSGTTQLGYTVHDLSDERYPGKLNTTALADSLAITLWRLMSA